MKIAPKGAESFLKAPAQQCRAVLIYGPDAGLVRERAERIRSTVLAGSRDPFAYVELDEKQLLEDPARLTDELRTVGLLSSSRLIGIRDGGDKLTSIIEDAAAHFHPEVFLLVTAEELPSRSSLRAFFEKAGDCAALACYRDEARDVQEVVRKAFTEAGIGADRDTMDYLMQQLGNDRYVTLQEIEKIIMFCNDNKKLSLEQAQALVDYNRDTNLDDVVQSVADRNLQALENMLQVQLREGTSPVAYLRALQRYFNRLYYIRSQMALGKGLEEVIANLKPKVFFKQEQPLKRHVQSWELGQIVKALGLLVRAELACKTSDIPPVAASSRRLFQVTQLR